MNTGDRTFTRVHTHEFSPTYAVQIVRHSGQYRVSVRSGDYIMPISGWVDYDWAKTVFAQEVLERQP